jgi:hypothetical protein
MNRKSSSSRGKPSSSSSSSLIFFTQPKGVNADCDAMERTVRQVERECQIAVERIDVLRNPAAAALLNRFGNSNSNNNNNGNNNNNAGSGQATPLLFHRESLQSLQGGKVSIDQVRAWAQGRLVIQRTKLQKNPNAPAPNIIDQDGQVEQGLDQSELLLEEDLSLTPQQREGKRLLEERSAEQQRKRSTKPSSS